MNVTDAGTEVRSYPMNGNWRDWLVGTEDEFANRMAEWYSAIQSEGDSPRYRQINQLTSKLFQLRQLINAYNQAVGGRVDGEGGVAQLLSIRANTVYQRIKHVGLAPQDFQKDGEEEFRFLKLVGRSKLISGLFDTLANPKSSEVGLGADARVHDILVVPSGEGRLAGAAFGNFLLTSLLNSLKSFSDNVRCVAREAKRETQAELRVHVFALVIGELHSENRYRFSREIFPQVPDGIREFQQLADALRKTESLLKRESDMLRICAAGLAKSSLINASVSLDIAANSLISSVDQFATRLIDSAGLVLEQTDLRDIDTYWSRVNDLMDQLLDSCNRLHGGWVSPAGKNARELIWKLCEAIQDQQMRCGSLNREMFKFGISLMTKFVYVLTSLLSDPQVDICEEDREMIDGVMDRTNDRVADLKQLMSRVDIYLRPSSVQENDPVVRTGTLA